MRASLENGAAFLTDGGAILASGDLTVTNSTISRNNAFSGGGGYLNLGATADIYSTLMNLNDATFSGGAINTGFLFLNGSQVRLNSAIIAGGSASTNTNVTLRSTIVRKNTPDNCLAAWFCQN